MATSSCPKCGQGSFEIATLKPAKSNFDLQFVQCSNCGSVVGTMTFFDAGILSKDNQKEIAVLKQKLDLIQAQIEQLSRKVRG
jgi:uncharacterized Zn finger protein